MTPDEAAVRIAELAVAAQHDEYKEIWEQWKAIDTKAQGVVVVSGIVLTGLFAILRDKPPSDDFSRVIVSASVVITFSAAVCALMAVRIRSVKAAPFGEQIANLVRQIQDKEEESQKLPERFAPLLNDIRNLWAKPLSDNTTALTDKSSWLWWAQVLIVVGMLCLGVVTIIRI